MDAIAVDAITALETAVGAALPAAVPAGLNRSVRVVTQRIRPTGLGGYVGLHKNPDASLYGRRLHARVDIRVAGGAVDAASAYAAQLSGQLLAQTRAELSQRGFQRLHGVAADDPAHVAFEVDFEYVPVPDAGEGVIERVDLSVFNNVTPYRARPRWDFDAAALAVLPAPMADFTAADDSDLDAGSPAGEWAFEAGPPPRIVQRRATRGGAFALTEPRKAGAQLLWRPGGAALALARGVVQFDVASASPNGIGVVFGSRAASDHWFFLMSQAEGYHVFGRRTPGGWQLVGAPAALGFSLAVRHHVTVGFHDRTLFAELDGERTLSVVADTAVAAGELGFLTHGNDGAAFFAGRLLELV